MASVGEVAERTTTFLVLPGPILETYVKIKGKWYYLYRAVDSTGQTIDFMLSAKRDARAAKRFFRKMLKAPKHQSPRVINVDQNKSYPPAVEELKEEGVLSIAAQ